MFTVLRDLRQQFYLFHTERRERGSGPAISSETWFRFKAIEAGLTTLNVTECGEEVAVAYQRSISVFQLDSNSDRARMLHNKHVMNAVMLSWKPGGM